MTDDTPTLDRTRQRVLENLACAIDGARANRGVAA